MPTLNQITNLLKPFPKKGNPKAWLKEYVTAPLKVAPELEEPLRAVCSKLAADQAAPASEEVQAFDKAMKELKKKWTEEFLEASKRTTRALDKWNAELPAEEAKVAQLKAKLAEFTSLTKNHVKEARKMKKLVSKEVSNIEDACNSAKKDLALQFAKAQLKLSQLKWRIKNARPLLKEKWLETLSSFKDVKLPEAIEWLVAPKYLLFSYSEVEEEDQYIKFPNDTEYFSSYTYKVKDLVIAYDRAESPWKEEDNWQMVDVKSLGRRSLLFIGSRKGTQLSIQEEGEHGTTTLKFEMKEENITDELGEYRRPIYWVDMKQKKDGEEGSITLIRETNL